MSVAGYPIGSTPTVTAEFRVGGVLTDPSTVLATVEDPAGAETTPTAVQSSTGIYTVTFTVGSAGLWHYRIVGDSPAPGVVEGDVFALTSAVLDSAPAPAYTYDVATEIGKVRLYIDDRDFSSVSNQTPLEQRSAIFDDVEMQQFVDAEGNLYRAAALALRTIANNRGLLVARREMDGATVDYGSLRRDLLASAAAFVDQAAAAPADGVAEMNWDQFAERRIVINAQLKSS